MDSIIVKEQWKASEMFECSEMLLYVVNASFKTMGYPIRYNSKGASSQSNENILTTMETGPSLPLFSSCTEKWNIHTDSDGKGHNTYNRNSCPKLTSCKSYLSSSYRPIIRRDYTVIYWNENKIGCWWVFSFFKNMNLLPWWFRAASAFKRSM